MHVEGLLRCGSAALTPDSDALRQLGTSALSTAYRESVAVSREKGRYDDTVRVRM